MVCYNCMYVYRLKDHCDQQKIRKIQLKKEIAQKVSKACRHLSDPSDYFLQLFYVPICMYIYAAILIEQRNDWINKEPVGCSWDCQSWKGIRCVYKYYYDTQKHIHTLLPSFLPSFSLSLRGCRAGSDYSTPCRSVQHYRCPTWYSS